MTETKSTRRKRTGTCSREGCGRPVYNPQHQTCSFVCDIVWQEIERAQRTCEATHDTELWVSAVALNDALTEYRDNDHRVYRAALEVGLTTDQWRSIKRGTTA